MATIGKSPATVNTTPFTFPNKPFKRLTIRLGPTASKTVYVNNKADETVSATNAQRYLQSGEAMEIDGASVQNGAAISIVAADSTVVFWDME